MKKIICIYSLLIIVSNLSGQTEKIVNPSDLKQQTVITEPLTLKKGFLRVGLFYSFALEDKWFNESGKKTYLSESAWGKYNSIYLWTQYGISDRLMIELAIPFVNNLRTYPTKILYPVYDTMVYSNPSAKERGLGDIDLIAEFQIIPSVGHKFSMKGTMSITIPTGRKNFKNVISASDYDGATGSGVLVLTPGITSRMVVYPFSITAYAQYSYSFKGSRMLYPTDLEETKLRNGGFFYGGATIGVHLNEWICLTNDLAYKYTGKGYIEGVSEDDLFTTWAIDYIPTLVFQIRRFRLGEAVSIPLKGKLGGSNTLYTLFAQYVF